MNLIKRILLIHLIASDERYLKACKRDGLISSIDVAAFDRRLQEMRVQLAMLENRLKVAR